MTHIILGFILIGASIAILLLIFLLRHASHLPADVFYVSVDTDDEEDE